MKNATFRILALMLLLQISANAQQPCESLTFKGVFEGHAYFYASQELSWEAANALAQAMGGHLAVITSEAENDFVAQDVLNGALAWIGLKETSREGRFAWVAGKRPRYTNWGPNEPNNAGGKESFTEINRGGPGKWNDLPAGFPRGFVVEFESGDINNNGIADVCETDIHPDAVAVAPTPSTEPAERNEAVQLLPATDAPSLLIFPNPASQEVQLQFQGLGEGEATLLLSDPLGRVVRKKALGAGQQHTTIPLSLNGLSTGEYFVQVFTDKGTVSKVLVVTGK